MFTKKEYTTLLIGGIIAFFITFILFFSYFYYTGTKHPLVEEEMIQSSESEIQSQTVAEVFHEEQVILPTTKVMIEVVDTLYKPILQKEINIQACIGMTKEEIEQRFQGYKLIRFDESKVILQKQFEAIEEPTTYTLVIQEGEVGILEKGNTTRFTSLNMSEELFSQANLLLFEGEGLPINHKQKLQLQQKPYYIEQILQNYNE